MAVEVFGNTPSTTVTSGGTTAPASGTQETWTVASSTGFPAASSSATPPTQFHVADVALNSEVISVINISGTTWTVIRGAESTTPVSHSAGFTVYQVVSAGGYAQLRSLDWLNVVTQFGADPTGAADSATAIQNAINALPAAGGVVYLPAGTYKVSSTVTNNVTPTYIAGDGRWATLVNFTGTGDCIRMYNPAGSGTAVGGGIQGLTIDGTSAGNSSTGLHAGDGSNYEWDFVVQNFSGTGSIGVHFDNTLWWTEKMHGNIYASNCTQNVVFDVSGATTSTNSFGYLNLHIWVNAAANQDGVVLQNGAFVYHGSLTIQGNFVGSSSVQSSYVLRLTGAVPAGHPNATAASRVFRSRLDIGVETSAGTHTPGTIFTNTASSNAILGCYGVMDFGLGAGSFTATNHPANSSQGTFWYSGIVNGDNNLNPGATPLPISIGGHLYSACFFNTNGDLFVASGDFFKLTLSGSITVNFNASTNPGAPRRITLIITQAAAGGPFTVTWPHTGSPTAGSPSVVWAGGSAPTMTATASAVDVYDLETIDGATWIGRATQNVS